MTVTRNDIESLLKIADEMADDYEGAIGQLEGEFAVNGNDFDNEKALVARYRDARAKLEMS